MTPRVLELERTVVEAWPALERLELDGWLLRASGGPTHRGNSVATLSAGSSLDLAARIERTEAWYRERGRPPMIHVGPCSVPSGLDAALAARGYVEEGVAWMTTAPAATVARHSTPALRSSVGGAPGSAARFHAIIDEAPSAQWLSIAAGASRFAASQDVFFGFLARLEGRCRFVLARTEDGTPAAACLCIQSAARVGVYAMFTLPSYRRRGGGRAVLHAAANAALAEGRRELYLLVEDTNAAARALYAGCGFEDVYRYHYRVLGVR